MAAPKSEKYANLAETTLASAYTAEDGQIVVASASGFPADGDFHLRLGDAGDATVTLFKVTSITGTTFTGTAEGTDSNIASGKAVTQVLTAGALDALRTHDCYTDTYANRMTAEKAGRIFLPSNGIHVARDTGSAWSQWGPIFPMTEPDDTDFTDDLGSPTKDTTHGGIILSVGPGTDSNTGRLFNFPAGDFVYEVAVLLMNRLEQYHGGGICLFDGTKIKALKFSTGTALTGVDVENWTNATTFSAAAVALFRIAFTTWIFLRFESTGTTWNYYWSVDGVSWELAGTEAENSYLTPTKIGIFVHNAQATRGTKAWFMHALLA